jgi:hypothetical protein
VVPRPIPPEDVLKKLNEAGFFAPGPLFQIPNAVLVNKSTNGGLTWSLPVPLTFDGPGIFNDKASITADPSNPNLVYVVWSRLTPFSLFGVPNAMMFTRTTDGGRTWEPARAVFTSPGVDFGLRHELVVLPDGTLVDLFTEVQPLRGRAALFVLRSADHGRTWSAPTEAAAIAPRPGGVLDPDTGQPVRTGAGLPEVAVDRHSGNLYAVWEDARFSLGWYDSIAFSMSSDGGHHWSAPVRINQTPLCVAPGNRQAFTPAIAVAADGTVAVSYYDFRFNDACPGLATDYWIVHGHPGSPGGLTNPANWGDELRLTDSSFDMEKAPVSSRRLPFNTGFSVGDYQGLASSGDAFIALFSHTEGTDPGNISFRRVGPLTPLEIAADLFLLLALELKAAWA